MKKKYQIRILTEQIAEALTWCQELFDDRWCYDLGIFYFEREDEAVALKLKFNESTRVLIIDPPSGWKYGFPKPYDKKIDQTLEEWLIENSYPRSLIDQNMSKYCRYWEGDV